MTLTTKQRNFLIFCGVLIVGWYVVRLIANAGKQAEFYRQQAMRKAQQPPARPAPPPVKRPVNPFLTTVNNLQGFWIGRGMLNTRGLCTLKLELRDVPDSAGHYTGYSTLGCQPVPSMFRMGGGRILPQEIRNMQNPKAVILTGEPQNGSIAFAIDKTVVGDAGECATSSFTATPFGTNRIAVNWTEGACRGGQLLLDRGVR